MVATIRRKFSSSRERRFAHARLSLSGCCTKTRNVKDRAVRETLLIRQDWISTGTLSWRPGSSDSDVSVDETKAIPFQVIELRWRLDTSPSALAMGFMTRRIYVAVKSGRRGWSGCAAPSSPTAFHCNMESFLEAIPVIGCIWFRIGTVIG